MLKFRICLIIIFSSSIFADSLLSSPKLLLNTNGERVIEFKIQSTEISDEDIILKEYKSDELLSRENILYTLLEEFSNYKSFSIVIKNEYESNYFSFKIVLQEDLAKDIFIFLDLVSVTAPIGILFGRISNFINGELVGKVTNSDWGVFFPNYDDKLRHPSQLYEAFLEGVILFILMNLIFFNKNYKIGTCSFMFLILYGCFRITSEIFREPDIQIGYLFGHVSMGMLLSVIMILIGFIIYFKRNDETKSQKI